MCLRRVIFRVAWCLLLCCSFQFMFLYRLWLDLATLCLQHLTRKSSVTLSILLEDKTYTKCCLVTFVNQGRINLVNWNLFEWAEPWIWIVLTGCSKIHMRSVALFPGLHRWAGTRKVKPIWILVKQETVSGSGISWAICKSAPHSRHTTTPAPHHGCSENPVN